MSMFPKVVNESNDREPLLQGPVMNFVTLAMIFWMLYLILPVRT